MYIEVKICYLCPHRRVKLLGAVSEMVVSVCRQHSTAISSAPAAVVTAVINILLHTVHLLYSRLFSLVQISIQTSYWKCSYVLFKASIQKIQILAR